MIEITTITKASINGRGKVNPDDLYLLLKTFPSYADRAKTSAVKSEMFRMSGVLKEGIGDGGTGGKKWPKLNPHTRVLNQTRTRGRIGSRNKNIKNFKIKWRGEKGKKQKYKEYQQVILGSRGGGKTIVRHPFARLKGLIRYKYNKSTGTGYIGFVKKHRALSGILDKQKAGYTTKVTPKMRKFFFAIGFPLKKSTTLLRTPQRSIIGPEYRRQEPQILENLQQKTVDNIMRYISGTKKARIKKHKITQTFG